MKSTVSPIFLSQKKNANHVLRKCFRPLLHSQKEPACRGCDPTSTLATNELALANLVYFFLRTQFPSARLTLANTRILKRRVFTLAPDSQKLLREQIQAS